MGARITRASTVIIACFSFWALPCVSASSDIVLPQDEGRHEGYKMETWTVYTFLENPYGEKIGVMVNFFTGRWSIFTGGAVMAGIVREGEKEAKYFHDIYLPFVGRMEHSAGTMNEKFGRHSLKRVGDVLKLVVHTEPFRLVLFMEPLKSPVSAGWKKAEGYSYPRLKANGYIIGPNGKDGKKEEVTGHAALVHVWSMTLEDDHDYFIIQLDDGTDASLVVTHDPHWAGPLEGSHGFITSSDGSPEPITFPLPRAANPPQVERGGEGVSITPTSWWTSPKTKRKYPASWDLSIPSRGISLRLAATADDQELRAMGLSYWMGTCHVRGKHNGKPVMGRAYAVLMGYAKSP